MHHSEKVDQCPHVISISVYVSTSSKSDQLALVYSLNFIIILKFLCIGENKKLDSYVMAAVLGYQSIDGLTKSTQFMYKKK